MALIVVGGQAKHIGKTSLLCAIIQRFVSCRWTAAKITSHVHEVADCDLVSAGSGWTICEQRCGDSNFDTARYLKAGAVRSLLVCAEPKNLAGACSDLQAQISSTANLIVESTAAATLLVPDLFLLVVNPEAQEFKISAEQQRTRADALVLSAGEIGGDSPDTVPIFCMKNNELEPGLAAMLERSLGK